MAKFDLTAETVTATASKFTDADKTLGKMDVKFVGFDTVDQSEDDEDKCIQKFVLRFKRTGVDTDAEVKHWLNYSYGSTAKRQKSMNYIGFTVRELQSACGKKQTALEDLNLQKALEVFDALVGQELKIDQHPDERADNPGKLTVSYITA